MFSAPQAPRTAPPVAIRPPAPIVAAPLPIPRRPPAWENLLARSAHGTKPLVLVVTLWTGVVLEVLSDPIQRRRYRLDQDGTIGELPPDSEPGRIVYATIEMALAWHQQRALLQARPPGTHCAAFYFGEGPGVEPLSFAAPFQASAHG